MAGVGAARLALDEDVRPLLATLLRERGWDALSVQDVGRRGLADEEQLAWASAERRVLVTHNARDFSRLVDEWTAAARTHAGLFVLRQGAVGTLLREALRALAQRATADAWTNQIAWGGRSRRG